MYERIRKIGKSFVIKKYSLWIITTCYAIKRKCFNSKWGKKCDTVETEKGGKEIACKKNAHVTKGNALKSQMALGKIYSNKFRGWGYWWMGCSKRYGWIIESMDLIFWWKNFKSEETLNCLKFIDQIFDYSLSYFFDNSLGTFIEPHISEKLPYNLQIPPKSLNIPQNGHYTITYFSSSVKWGSVSVSFFNPPIQAMVLVKHPRNRIWQIALLEFHPLDNTHQTFQHSFQIPNSVFQKCIF